MILKKSFLFLIVLVFIACGGGSTSETQTTATTVTVSGTVTYDFVPFKSGLNSGLDYNNISQKKVRGAVVQVLNSSNTVLGKTNTDANGFYSIEVTGTSVKVRVLARLNKPVSAGQSSWDFQVKDNTNSNALYAVEESLANLGTNGTQTRNLNAPSGWGGSSYTGTRFAAPFSILDVVYQAIHKVTTAQSDAVFDPLDVFWSINNKASVNRNVTIGEILTSHYDGTALFILGAANSDTDEYDTAIVAHEWGHYYEAKFSRSDSIGGGHGNGDMLDIRVAFGEGFGTAIGCMIIDNPLYLDSSGLAQGSTGVFANLENGGNHTNPGWYSEQSIYSILYDVYDTVNDSGDTLSLGFTPIHDLFINAQKNTAAFTSIFTFITALKAENPGNDTAIDALTTNESISPITNIYGTGRTNRMSQNANPLYYDLTVGGSVNVVTNYSATSSSPQNKLGTYNFVKFTIPTSRSYTFNISQVGGSGTPDPDFTIYKSSSSTEIGAATASGTTDSLTTTLTPGTYRMAVIVYNQSSGNTFNITLN